MVPRIPISNTAAFGRAQMHATSLTAQPMQKLLQRNMTSRKLCGTKDRPKSVSSSGGSIAIVRPDGRTCVVAGECAATERDALTVKGMNSTLPITRKIVLQRIGRQVGDAEYGR
jgi:hypothetical protein